MSGGSEAKAPNRTTVGAFVMQRGGRVSTMTEPVADIDEGLRWATAGGVRVWDYIDRLLDQRLEAMRCDA